MIDPRTPVSSAKVATATGIDWRNAYLGPGPGGALSAWPGAAAQAVGAPVLEELFLGLVLSPNEALREQPAHRAALSSELWMGEFVRVLHEEDGWWLVGGEDGYVGWMRSWASRACPPEEREELIRRWAGVFSSPTGWLKGEGGSLAPLMGGCPLLRPRGSAPRGVYSLVDGARGRLDAAEVEAPGVPADPARMVDRATSILGTAYRWGGRTPWGIDCSGLVQWAALRSGFQLERDAIQQARVGQEIARDRGAWIRGDLLYFHRPVDHVGIYDGEGGLVHARARVRAQRLEEIPDLLEGLVMVRRLGESEQIQRETLWRRIPRAAGFRA